MTSHTPENQPHRSPVPRPLIGHDMWVVVADKTRARIFMRTGNHFEEIREFVAPAAMIEGNLNYNVGRTDKHEQGPNENRQSELALARQIAGYLERGEARRDFTELTVTAAPQMLGEIRKNLSKNVLRVLVAESDKNLLGLTDSELQEALLDIIPGPHRR